MPVNTCEKTSGSCVAITYPDVNNENNGDPITQNIYDSTDWNTESGRDNSGLIKSLNGRSIPTDIDQCFTE